MSGSESSGDEMADDDNDVTASNSLHQPLLQHTDPPGANHLSRQARQALKHLHAVDDNVRTVVSAVVSSRTLYPANRSVLSLPRRQDSVPLWNRIRCWVFVVGAAFIFPVIIVLYMKLVGS